MDTNQIETMDPFIF